MRRMLAMTLVSVALFRSAEAQAHRLGVAIMLDEKSASAPDSAIALAFATSLAHDAALAFVQTGGSAPKSINGPPPRTSIEYFVSASDVPPRIAIFVTSVETGEIFFSDTIAVNSGSKVRRRHVRTTLAAIRGYANSRNSRSLADRGNLVHLASAAIQAAPWNSDTTGKGVICSTTSPCDTVVVETRILRSPNANHLILLPGKLPVLTTLTDQEVATLRVPGIVVTQASRDRCWARREQPGWSRAGVACVVVALVQDNATSTSTWVALEVLSPINGNTWLHFQIAENGHLVLRMFATE